jgi:hypothetical protein
MLVNYTYARAQPDPSYDFRGRKTNPSLVWLMVDEDNANPGDPTRLTENYPDVGDNHGRDGGHAVFADGHAEWVKRK